MKKLKKIMVFGVFDLLHPGHIYFLKQAKAVGDFLIVSVARDKNAYRVKGQKPYLPQKDRLQILKSIEMVDRAILGEVHKPFKQIKKILPDVIALGYDQASYLVEGGAKELEKFLRDKKIVSKVIRIGSYKPNIYKSSKIRKQINSSHKPRIFI